MVIIVLSVFWVLYFCIERHLYQQHSQKHVSFREIFKLSKKKLYPQSMWPPFVFALTSILIFVLWEGVLMLLLNKSFPLMISLVSGLVFVLLIGKRLLNAQKPYSKPQWFFIPTLVALSMLMLSVYLSWLFFPWVVYRSKKYFVK